MRNGIAALIRNLCDELSLAAKCVAGCSTARWDEEHRQPFQEARVLEVEGLCQACTIVAAMKLCGWPEKLDAEERLPRWTRRLHALTGSNFSSELEPAFKGGQAIGSRRMRQRQHEKACEDAWHEF